MRIMIFVQFDLIQNKQQSSSRVLLYIQQTPNSNVYSPIQYKHSNTISNIPTNSMKETSSNDIEVQTQSKQIQQSRQKLMALKGSIQKFVGTKKSWNTGQSAVTLNVDNKLNLLREKPAKPDNIKPPTNSTNAPSNFLESSNSYQQMDEYPDFNSTLFRNSSLFHNKDKDRNDKNENLKTGEDQKPYLSSHSPSSSLHYKFTSQPEEPSGSSNNSGQLDFKRYNQHDRSRENNILSKIDSLLSSIDQKKYGAHTNQINSSLGSSSLRLRNQQRKQDSDHPSRQLSDKYNLSDLNINSSINDSLSHNYDFPQSATSFLNKSDHVNQNSHRIPLSQKDRSQTFHNHPSHIPFNKLKTIQEEQQQLATLTIDANTRNAHYQTNYSEEGHTKITSIQKQKAKIRQAMSARKKITEEIIAHRTDSILDSFKDKNQHILRQNGSREKEVNISIDFELSDEDDSIFLKHDKKQKEDKEKFENQDTNTQMHNREEFFSRVKDKKQDFSQLYLEKERLLQELKQVQQQLESLEAETQKQL